MSEITSPRIAEIASRAMRDPKSLTESEIRSLAASALTQAADKATEAEADDGE